jgi:hypothetical protein
MLARMWRDAKGGSKTNTIIEISTKVPHPQPSSEGQHASHLSGDWAGTWSIRSQPAKLSRRGHPTHYTGCSGQHLSVCPVSHGGRSEVTVVRIWI